jgi:hypothetical protein
MLSKRLFHHIREDVLPKKKRCGQPPADLRLSGRVSARFVAQACKKTGDAEKTNCVPAVFLIE